MGLSATCLSAQEASVTRGRRIPRETIRELESKTSPTTKDLEREYFTWQRTVYRQLNLEDERNLTLAYRDKSRGAMGYDLTTLIFSLAAEGKIKLYEYIDGEEQLDAEHEMSFALMQERFGLAYTSVADTPSRDVRAYYIKELHYFDQSRSSSGRQVEALCPVLYTLGDYGEQSRPLFWIKYSELSPYLVAIRPLSAQNEAVRGTYADFFRLGMYHGPIVRAQGLGGKSLIEQSATPEELRQRQEQVEQELRTVRPTLSLPDSIVRKSEQRSKPSQRLRPAKVKTTKDKSGRTSGALSVRGLS